MFDVALSFAGEQREYVERVAELLRAREVKVFYDRYETATLWGKNLYDHLADVYENQARYVVIFASADYAQKAWTNHERQSAQARALREKTEYVLPARFDDTAIPGLPNTVGYVDLRTTTPEELAELIAAKLAKPRRERLDARSNPADASASRPEADWPAEARAVAEQGAWCSTHRPNALAKLRDLGKNDFYEICASLAPPLEGVSQKALVDAVASANIDTFGWPIGVYIPRKPARPRMDGVAYEIRFEERDTYDQWALSTSGHFYLLKTLSEDALGSPESLFFNTRVVRVGETVLFLSRLYLGLGAAPTSEVRLTIRHVGLSHRPLSAAGTRRHTLSAIRTTDENEVETSARFTLESAEADLVEIVKTLLAPLFMVYEFFVLSDDVYRDLLESFRKGVVT